MTPTNRVDRILDLLSDEGQHSAETGYPSDSGVYEGTCWRCMKSPVAEESDLCQPCRDFLLEDSDEDPCEQGADQLIPYPGFDLVWDLGTSLLTTTFELDPPETPWPRMIDALRAASRQYEIRVGRPPRYLMGWCHPQVLTDIMDGNTLSAQQYLEMGALDIMGVPFFADAQFGLCEARVELDEPGNGWLQLRWGAYSEGKFVRMQRIVVSGVSGSPVRDSLPVVRAPRGGIVYTSPPDFGLTMHTDLPPSPEVDASGSTYERRRP